MNKNRWLPSFLARGKNLLNLDLTLASGRRVRMGIHGQASDSVLICIGGLGTPSSLFSSIAERIEDIKQLITYEYEWQSESSRVPNNLDEHADDLADILHYLHPKRFSILSFCMGAKVAVRFAERHPVQFEKFIFVNPNVVEKYSTDQQAKIVTLLKYAVKNQGDSRKQCYQFVQAVVDRSGTDPFKVALAYPYVNGPDMLYWFGRYAQGLIMEDVDCMRLDYLADKITVIVDKNSELSDSRNATDLFGVMNIRQLDILAGSGHYSLLDDAKFISHVVKVI